MTKLPGKIAWSYLAFACACPVAWAQWPKAKDQNFDADTSKRAVTIGCAITVHPGENPFASLNFRTPPFGDAVDDKRLSNGLSIGASDMSILFDIDPEYGIYDDDPPNAVAFPYDITQSNGQVSDGTVLLGRKLVSEEKRRDRYFWGASITLILAHEFGHIRQYKNKMQGPSVQKELHADYLAGWYMGFRNAETRGLYANIEASALSLFDKGDYAFNSPTHHGTPAQRIAAMREGYRAGFERMPQAQAYQRGISAVKFILR